MRQHFLDERLQHLDTGASAEARLAVIWEAYEENTGRKISRPPNDDERVSVLRWLREQRKLDDMPMLLVRKPRAAPAAHQTVVEKAGMISQFGCDRCDPIEENESGESGLDIRFAVDIEPWTAQSTRDKVKIRETVTRRMTARGIYKPTTDPVCISVVSLTRKISTQKDCDNLVKGLLDSFEGLLYLNDRQIQCLTARRMQYRGPRGAYFVMARAVREWTCDVIVDDGMPPIIH